MALTIRFRQQGRTNRTFYRLVVTDSRYPRDGKYLEMVGWYNPIENDVEKATSFNIERIQHWISVGAQLSERAATMISKKSPETVTTITQREVAQRAKRTARRKAKKQAQKKK